MISGDEPWPWEEIISLKSRKDLKIADRFRRQIYHSAFVFLDVGFSESEQQIRAANLQCASDPGRNRQLQIRPSRSSCEMKGPGLRGFSSLRLLGQGHIDPFSMSCDSTSPVEKCVGY